MLRPYLVASLLVEQPTWGGEYIAQFKKLTDPSLDHKKIGQAFELASDSLLVTSDDSGATPFSIAVATNLAGATWTGQPDQLLPIQQLIDQDPAGVLGAKALKKYGAVMKILIKFTQATGFNKINNFLIIIYILQLSFQKVNT